MRKWNPARDLLAQKFAKWCPTLANIVFEKAVWGNNGADLLVIFVKDAFSIFEEVTFPEDVEKGV